MFITITHETRGQVLSSQMVELTFDKFGASSRANGFGCIRLHQSALSSLSATGRTMLATSGIGAWYANL